MLHDAIFLQLATFCDLLQVSRKIASCLPVVCKNWKRQLGSVITQARPRGKPDVFSATETSFKNWLNHFELCARINGWSNEQACQQFV